MEQKRKSRKTILLIAAGILIVCGGLFYWSTRGNYESTDNAQVDGNIISIRSGVSGYITRICFDDNEIVKKGRLLFTLDTVELQAKADEAGAALEYARADLGIAKNEAVAGFQNSGSYSQSSKAGAQDVASAKANLENARNDYRRAGQLLAIKAVTQEQYEKTQTALRTADAAYSKAINQYKASLSSAGSFLTQAKVKSQQTALKLAVIQQREAELTMARNLLEKARVTAPFNGRVTKRAVQVGQYVSAGQSLCAVIDNEHYWISANFKETQLPRIKTGQKVEIKIDAWKGKNLEGVVESLSGATGARFALIPADNATGNFIKIVQRVPVRIRLNTTGRHMDNDLFPGLSAFVKVNTD